jgi:ATP-dependent DNA helicase RecQ
MTLPKTIENYYQEIGRAGRDGLPSETLLLFGAQDIVQQRSFIDDLPDTPYREHALTKLDAMARFAGGEACRHQAIAAYFNDAIEACGTVCDNCTMPASEKIGITTAARKLLSAIWRTEQRFGLHYVVDVLRGSRDQRVIENGHDALSVYGIGEEYSRAQWLTIGDRLLEMKAVEVGEYRVYALTSLGVGILKGSHPVELKKERLTVQKTKAKKQPLDLDKYDAEVFEALRSLRMEIATTNNIPPYVVFSDKTLKDMSIKRPENRMQMLEVHGVGEVKFERYGEEFLALLHRTGNIKQVLE